MVVETEKETQSQQIVAAGLSGPVEVAAHETRHLCLVKVRPIPEHHGPKAKHPPNHQT